MKQQDTMRTHSFQIVRLQNQLLELQNAKTREEEKKNEILEELDRARTEIAYLKGRLAGLTVEFYSSSGDSEQQTEARPQNLLVNELYPNLGSSHFKHAIVETSHEAALVADQLLNEQRPGLIKALVRQLLAKN